MSDADVDAVARRHRAGRGEKTVFVAAIGFRRLEQVGNRPDLRLVEPEHELFLESLKHDGRRVFIVAVVSDSDPTSFLGASPPRSS